MINYDRSGLAQQGPNQNYDNYDGWAGPARAKSKLCGWGLWTVRSKILINSDRSGLALMNYDGWKPGPSGSKL